MNETDRRPEAQPPDPGDPAGATDAAAARDDEAAAAGDVFDMEAEHGPLDTLRAEHAELHDKYLRLAAEFQNFKKRAQQNVVQARELQAMSMARDLLAALDHFDNALSVDPDTTSAADLLKGVTSIRDELLRALAAHGVQRLDAAPGDAFDPNHHEALMRQPSDELDSGAVAAQLQPGYTLRGKTLRPAKVAVVE